jgi:hypothetical protein
MSSPLNISISSKIKKEGRQASFQRIDISEEGLQINQETKVVHWNRFRTTALFLILMFERFTVLVAREVSCQILRINKEGRHHSSELIFQDDGTILILICLKVLIKRETEVNAKLSKGEVRREDT